MYDHNAVKIYTDGSAKPNPGKGGIGIVIEFPDRMDQENFELSKGYKESTNNRMELRAVICALEWLQDNSPRGEFTRAVIITDSEYVYSNHSKAQYWKTNNWRTLEGKPYENEDLWNTFLKQRQKTKLHHEIAWNKGKQSAILLRVDALAKHGRDNPTETDYGFKAGKFTGTRINSRKGATLFPAQGQEAVIRVYRKNLYGKNDTSLYKISFDLYDEFTLSYVTKHVAYAGDDCIMLKRNNCYRVSFNESLTLPLILLAVPIEYIKGI